MMLPKQVIRRLTPREAQIIKLIAVGHTSEQAAGILKISPRTVETHLFNAKLRLDTINIKHTIAISISQGLIAI